MTISRRSLLAGLWNYFLAAPLAAALPSSDVVRVKIDRHHSDDVSMKAGTLRRLIGLRDGVPFTRSLEVDREEVLSGPSGEISFTVRKASPNHQPRGLKAGQGVAVDVIGKQLATDVLDVQNFGTDEKDQVKWVDPVVVDVHSWTRLLGSATLSRVRRIDRYEVVLSTQPRSLGIAVTIHYMVYDRHPAIRKWIEIRNDGVSWLKIDQLRLETWKLAHRFGSVVELTPVESGVESSLIARGLADGTRGVILGSEVPSALRLITPDGSMGYADNYFEWVIGPGETFVSEPVFVYAYSGTVQKTISAISTPLDRTVEGPFQNFLRQDIGLVTDPAKIQAPQYSSWTTFGPNIDDALIRQLADIASAVGFKLFELDQGWQRGNLGTEPDTTKFPNFISTTDYIRSKGMRVGLWVSTYRTPGAKDFTSEPDGASRPTIKRAGGVGMSFASSWKSYFASDLASLSRSTGATYFKQDFSDIRFGDIAVGHEGRTRKESLLRGLRGLFDAEDALRREAPAVAPELTHEIYWGTPGAPCDLAALKHVQSFHIPPNDYSGTLQGRAKSELTKTFYANLPRDLIEGAFNARKRIYGYRGLPLYSIEYFGAATFNARGSLTPEIQDRQVASWLMGVPAVFSGDLRTLTPENIKRYRSRFDMLDRLERTYCIYCHFQFSGVPEPTDSGWHWWGKLNEKGYGAVVALRGSGGTDSQAVNIPWVRAHTKYRVHALFTDKNLGNFSGSRLQRGGIHLSLRKYDQEILEIAPI